MISILTRIEKELEQLRSIERFRRTKETLSEKKINLASNSYLNLENNIKVQERSRELLTTNAGNGASRLVQSSSPLFDKLEKTIAQWKNSETALLFNSGYAANTGILQAIGRKGTEIFSDRLNHASIIDGIQLSGAKMIRYTHSSLDDLEKKLKNSTATEKIVVTDSIFSMDGDIAPLSGIAELGIKYHALVMVDEAHSTGLYGQKSSGLIEELGLTDHIHIKMGTLSKAIAGTGGFFAGSKLLRDYLVNNARSFIFSTALAESNLAWNIAAIEEIQKDSTNREMLHSLIRFAVQELSKLPLSIGNSDSAIIPIIVGDDHTAMHLSNHLSQAGFIAPAIRPPTVPFGTSRVRLTLHTGLTKKDLQKLIVSLKVFFDG